MSDKIIDSPTDRVSAPLRAYVESNGVAAVVAGARGARSRPGG
ncbi:hypothetical protein [Streptosporangium sp. NPDC006930]